MQPTSPAWAAPQGLPKVWEGRTGRERPAPQVGKGSTSTQPSLTEIPRWPRLFLWKELGCSADLRVLHRDPRVRSAEGR